MIMHKANHDCWMWNAVLNYSFDEKTILMTLSSCNTLQVLPCTTVQPTGIEAIHAPVQQLNYCQCGFTLLIAFDEGRTLPNLLGRLLSRRFPVQASESWPVFFRSIVHLFGAILNDVTISLRKAFCLVLRCLSDVLEGSSFIILPRLRHKQLSYGNHVHHWFHQGQLDDYTGIFEFGKRMNFGVVF